MKYTVTLMLAAVNGVFAQSPSRTIKGTVLDSANHKPISQATIFVGRMTAGRTGNDGTFRVSADQDPTMLMVRRPGYIPAVVALPQDTAAIEKNIGTLSLPPVKTDADRAVVQDADTRMFPELAAFYDHKARYRQGVFLSPDDLQRVGGKPVCNDHAVDETQRSGDGAPVERSPRHRTLTDSSACRIRSACSRCRLSCLDVTSSPVPSVKRITPKNGFLNRIRLTS